MKTQTRKMLLKIATGIAVAATAAAIFLPVAQAAPGVVTSNVNVRSGPGTSYGVVDTIARGTQVDVQRCQGSWCYVAKTGPDGWVSASYLSAGGRPANPTQPGLSFGFQVGPDGPSINFGTTQPQRPPVFRPPNGRPSVGRPPVGRPPVGRPVPLPQPVYSQVCFYESVRFGGEGQCLNAGDSISDLSRYGSRISSLDNPDGLRVEVCVATNFRDCRTYTSSASSLGDFNGNIRSIRIR